MERAEHASPSLVKEANVQRVVSNTDRAVKSWVWPAILQGGLIITVAVFAWLTWLQLERVDERTRGLVMQSQDVKREVGKLREYLASEQSVDVIFLKIMVTKPNLDRDLARVIAKNVHKYAALYSQDPDLVLAIIAVESDFNPNAVSNMGAQGLMQVMPQWKQVLGISEDLRDPETSIKYGLQILGFYQQMYKDRQTAITAYNRGPGPVDMALMRGKDPTNHYAPLVLKRYEHLKSLHVGQL